MNTFVLVQNNFYKNPTRIWYQKIDGDVGLEKFDAHATQYTHWYWNTFWSDPHNEAAIAKGDEGACIRHPMNLLPKRNAAMVKVLLREGHVLINKNGGWCYLTPDCEILETVVQESWPVDVNSQTADGRFQYVYIGRWPQGNHYYLMSWPLPIQFSAEKFNTYEEAVAEAKKHVPESRIKWKEAMHDKFIYNKEGD